MPAPAAHITPIADTVSTARQVDTTEVFVPQYLHGFERTTSLQESNPLKDLQETIISIPEGFFAEPIPETPTNNSFSLIIVIVFFLLFAFSFKKGIKFLGQILRSQLNIKERQNIFGDNTIRETQLRAVLLCMTFVSEGFFLFDLLARYSDIPTSHIGIGVCCGSLIALMYYWLQKWVYTGIGLLFSSPAHTRKWMESFVSTNALLSIPLALVAMVSIFIPSWGQIPLVVAVVIYFASRILFIYKGFKIFYRNLLDLFYFIVYLCALEITPLFWVYQSCGLIYHFVELKIISQL